MSAPIDDGGPAFACAVASPDGDKCLQEGMSLRDWFAGQALAGLLYNYHEHPNTIRDCADMAYKAADAMLAARKEKK